MLLVSNNPKVLHDQDIKLEKLAINGDYADVLKEVRDRIHKGHRLLSHPLSGSVKPNETPFKSVLISRTAGDLDLKSLEIIENSLETFEKFSKNMAHNWYDRKEEIIADFSEIDYSLIKSALENIS